MKFTFLISALLAIGPVVQAKDRIITVRPGSPRETFLVGAKTKSEGDYIHFVFTVSPRTTKSTLPFDCALSLKNQSIGWHIDSPCFDERSKRVKSETISLKIPANELADAHFEFRYHIPQSDITEIWRMKLTDYQNGADPK
ncbi:MAG: hypothetical protein V4710_20150 [Verrucomicrobiota bacterium]